MFCKKIKILNLNKIYKMNKDETRLVESIVNFNGNLDKALDYVNEHYGVEAYYNEADRVIGFNNKENTLQQIAAKEYLEETLGADMVAVVL